MKKINNAFTLLEIMIVIALVGIIMLGVSKLNFNALSDRQKLDGFFYKIKTNIETIQNNALIGKAIKNGSNTFVPEKWKIDFNNSGSGKIISNYYNGSNYVKYSELIPNRFYSIEIYNKLSLISESDTGSLLIEGGNLSLTGINSTNKTLQITAKYKNLQKKFTINTISGVIEEE